VKDLVTKNVGDEHIVFCEDASNIVSHPSRPRKTSIPVISVRIGDHCYYGLCDIGASSSAIPFELYREIMHEISPCELEDIDVVIQLANRETVLPIGIVRDVEVLCGKTKYHTDFLVLGTEASKTCPIIFGRPFCVSSVLSSHLAWLIFICCSLASPVNLGSILGVHLSIGPIT
jgi:hypothetical protein